MYPTSILHKCLSTAILHTLNSQQILLTNCRPELFQTFTLIFKLLKLEFPTSSINGIGFTFSNQCLCFARCLWYWIQSQIGTKRMNKHSICLPPACELICSGSLSTKISQIIQTTAIKQPRPKNWRTDKCSWHYLRQFRWSLHQKSHSSSGMILITLIGRKCPCSTLLFFGHFVRAPTKWNRWRQGICNGEKYPLIFIIYRTIEWCRP